jgi:oligoendopeptidase F
MAQLGAIALWRNYLKNPDQTIQDYFNALKLGYSATIGEVYKTAGIKFDFSRSYIRELSDFISEQLRKPV